MCESFILTLRCILHLLRLLHLFGGLPPRQLVGRPHAEQALLAVAALYEAGNPQHFHHPTASIAAAADVALPDPYLVEGPRSAAEAEAALGLVAAGAAGWQAVAAARLRRLAVWRWLDATAATVLAKAARVVNARRLGGDRWG